MPSMPSPLVASQTPDVITVNGLQSRFGTIDYSRWQAQRQEFYSYIPYPVAGGSQFVFFGNAVGTNVGSYQLTYEDTNMPRAGSFGQQHFLVKTISTDIRIKDLKLNTWDGTDASTLASDYLMGFLNAGVLNFSIGARPFLVAPKPFQVLPPLSTRIRGQGAGLTSVAAVGPLTAYAADQPLVQQTSNRDNVYRFDPALLIEAEQQFGITIDFPSGPVPIISTGVVNDSTNPLQVGVKLSGVLLRPMQ